MTNPVQAGLSAISGGALASPFAGSIFGGDKGGASGPIGANLIQPVSQDQLNGQNAAVNTAQGNQAAFLQALQAQNGLQNQSSVFNQLQDVTNGTGPNPAQAMLANASGQNVANTAALMAGQRGASSNPGLIARQAGMAGANAGQNLAGQAAGLQAQQSLNALGQQGALANQQAAQLNAGQQGYTNAALQGQQNALGAITGYNNAQVGSQSNINNINAGTNQQRNQGIGNIIGGLTGGIGAALNLPGSGGVGSSGGSANGGNLGISLGAPQLSSGGYAEGGEVKDNLLADSVGASDQFLKATPAASSGGSGDGGIGAAISLGAKILPALLAEGGQASSMMQFVAKHKALAEGGKVPALVSPGEKYLTPKKVQQVANGANPMKIGETIPGKPKVGGAVNSYQNDNVKKKLDEGGIIVPRSITKSKDADQAAREFVATILDKKALK